MSIVLDVLLTVLVGVGVAALMGEAYKMGYQDGQDLEYEEVLDLLREH